MDTHRVSVTALQCCGIPSMSLVLEKRQLAGLVLLFSDVMGTKDGFVEDSGQVEGAVDVSFFGDCTELAIHSEGDFVFEETLFLDGGIHTTNCIENHLWGQEVGRGLWRGLHIGSVSSIAPHKYPTTHATHVD